MKEIIKFLFNTCYIIFWLYFMFVGGCIEWMIIKDSIIQFFNPFVYLLVLIQLLQIPFTYVIIIPLIICFVLYCKFVDD